MGLHGRSAGVVSAALAFASTIAVFGQIDPDKRQLLQLGYNASFEGHAPLAGYAFYYLNRPEFHRENMTLRMAIAPVYLDTELGFAKALGPNTDFGVGVSGGGFADSFNEVREGKYIPRESFDGYGGGASASIYHLFNPDSRIPLYGVLRAGAYYTTYSDIDYTGDRFDLPEDNAAARFRGGLRFGGKEPVLFPPLAMELSIWAESINRSESGNYGYNGDREMNESVGLFYAHAYLSYTFERGDNASASITAGDSANADRLTAYRLGGVLPLVAEYPLIIPGYFYQELTAERFALFNARYALALDELKRWQVTAMVATAVVDYVEGMEQARRWNSGVGGGVMYRSQSEIWKAALTYGYGIDAIRGSHRGAHVVGVMVQFDLEKWLYKHRSKPFPWELPY
jgi:hypothetical protein